jgi:hypothetical protein
MTAPEPTLTAVDALGASWHAFLAEQYRNERVRKGFNDAAEASR